MEVRKLQVNMLGGMSIHLDGKSIEHKNIRSGKSWLLLAYLFYHKDKPVSYDSLCQILWENDSSITNPSSSLKALLHRTRALLDTLEDGLGIKLIVSGNRACSIGNGFDVELDYLQFEKCAKFCVSSYEAAPMSEIISNFQTITTLYKGDFLPAFADEHWIAPVNIYFHNLYMDAMECVSHCFENEGLFHEAANACRYALLFEPYNEELNYFLLKNLYKSGNNEGVIAAYDKLRNLLADNFGTMPDDETTAIYRKASSEISKESLISEDIYEHLREPICDRGALICEFDIFKMLYRANARQVVRNGEIFHVVLLSISGTEKELSKKSRDKVMDNFKMLLFKNLRTGDIISKCSPSQYIVLLPQANYENSRMVCERIIRAYKRVYPHSPATISYTIQPLEPNMF